MGKQFAQLVGHTNHRQKIHYVQKLTNENLSLKKVCTYLNLILFISVSCLDTFSCVHAFSMFYLCTYVCMLTCGVALCACAGGDAASGGRDEGKEEAEST